MNPHISLTCQRSPNDNNTFVCRQVEHFKKGNNNKKKSSKNASENAVESQEYYDSQNAAASQEYYDSQAIHIASKAYDYNIRDNENLKNFISRAATSNDISQEFMFDSQATEYMSAKKAGSVYAPSQGETIGKPLSEAELRFMASRNDRLTTDYINYMSSRNAARAAANEASFEYYGSQKKDSQNATPQAYPSVVTQKYIDSQNAIPQNDPDANDVNTLIKKLHLRINKLELKIDESQMQASSEYYGSQKKDSQNATSQDGLVINDINKVILNLYSRIYKLELESITPLESRIKKLEEEIESLMEPNNLDDVIS